MGNQQSVGSRHSRGILSKLKKRKEHRPSAKDEFIIKHSQKNRHNHISMSIDTLDTRRIVFVSLLGLFNTWKKCPSFLLYTAICVLPLKRKWIYNPSNYIEEMKTSLMSQINLFLANVSETKEFVQLLQWKDSQGLVCWALDEFVDGDRVNDESLIRPFWCDFSTKLQRLYDHITEGPYNGLKLDANWWVNKREFMSKYNNTPSNILSELYFLTMKYKTIQEIVFQSNPNSLRAVKCYEANPNTALQESSEYMKNMDQYPDPNVTDDEDQTNWVFTDAYE